MAETVRCSFRQKTIEGEYIHIAFEGLQFSPIKTVSDEMLGEYIIETPLLEVGDAFFLADINKYIIIKERIRSSDGSIVYYAEDEIVVNENTLTDTEKYNSLLEEFNDYKKEYKYKHKFFNF